MKILYVWIEKYKKLNCFQTNFGSPFTFNFDSVNTLSIYDNNYYIMNFFKNGSNTGLKKLDIAAIVGENGAGKSSIIDFLIDYNKGISTSIGHYILIYEHNEEIFIHYYLNENIDLIKVDNTKLGVNIKSKSLSTSGLLMLVFSNVFDVRYIDMSNDEDLTSLYNISTNALLGRHTTIDTYLNEELEKQIFFINQYEAELNLSEIINTPSKIKINVLENTDKDFIIDKLSEKIFSYFHDIELFYFTNSDKFNKDFTLRFLESYFAAVYIEIFSEDLKFTFSEYPFHELLESTTINEFFTKSKKSFLRVLKINNSKEKSSLEAKLEFLAQKFHDFYDYLNEVEFSIKLSENFNKDGDYKVVPSLEIEVNTSKNKHFLKIYRDTFQVGNCFRFSWSEMSSGEYAFLTLFSRFYDVLKDLDENEYPHSFLLLIDEGELYFHPQWQKEWLFYFLKMIHLLFKGNVQVILTTHSPFVLSDIPNTYVTFIKDNLTSNFTNELLEGSSRTFAANINDLFSNSFFIKDGLVGKFAKEKINNFVSELLRNDQFYLIQNREYIEKFIDLIGEPIVRNRIFEIYNDKIKIYERKSIETRIMELEKELNELKMRNLKND